MLVSEGKRAGGHEGQEGGRERSGRQGARVRTRVTSAPRKQPRLGQRCLPLRRQRHPSAASPHKPQRLPPASIT